VSGEQAERNTWSAATVAALVFRAVGSEGAIVLVPQRFTPAFVLVACVGTAALGHEADAILADALKCQDRTAAFRMLEQGADVNAAQVDGMTALHWAVYRDDLELAERLVQSGADANAQNRYGVAPLSIACQNGSGPAVRLLLTAGADPQTTLHGGETALMTAARTGVLEPVEALLEHGADVNARERKGQTALMWAAAEGHAAVVDALIAAGADFRATLRSGFSPWFFAVREGRSEVVQTLLAAGVDVNQVLQPPSRSGRDSESGPSALILAVENGHFELADALLRAGADSNDRRAGYTALHAVTWVRKPLRGDGDPPPMGSGSLTSLEWVRRLVAHGAEVNARHGAHRPGGARLNRTNATPFLLAAETGDLPLMRLLLDLGADPHLPNVDDVTPLLAAAGVGVLGDGDEAAGTEDEAIGAVQLLLELGADIDAVESHGETAMHGAAYKSRARLIEFLADQGGDIDVWNRRNRRGWTPLMIAQGHRPGNFRPSAETVAAIRRVLAAAGVEPKSRP
jgi:ankyrin repeat protein